MADHGPPSGGNETNEQHHHHLPHLPHMPHIHHHQQHEVEEEFGETKDRVEFHERRPSDTVEGGVGRREAAALAHALEHGKSPEKAVRRAQWRRLGRRLVHRRWLRQYFSELGVLRREPNMRKVSNEELYLDLIIVANIAAIGHEFRHSFGGWPEVEQFILLFGAVYSSWRTVAFFWNLFGTDGDLADKVLIYFTHAAMCGIGLGAHAAFTKARRFVGISSFLASAIPAIAHAIASALEPAASNEHNLFNQGVANSVLVLVSVLPYLIAAFVDSERTARNLFWVSFGLLLTTAVRFAVNIEAMVEKYGVLTLIVLGESLLTILFEGAELITQPNASVSNLYGAAAASVLIVYAMQTMYFNVDNFLPKGSAHAIRHSRWNGIIWANIHIFYHMCLAGFLPVGLGLLIRDLTLQPVEGAEAARELIVRAAKAAGESELSGEEISRAGRWVFSVGWGMSILLSSATGFLHKAGPRGLTKNRRIVVRMIGVGALMIGLPFTNIAAGPLLALHGVVTAVLAVLEFVLIEADRIGLTTGKNISSGGGASIGDATPKKLDGDDGKVEEEEDDDDLDDDDDFEDDLDNADGDLLEGEDAGAGGNGEGDVEQGNDNAGSVSAPGATGVRQRRCRQFETVMCKKRANKLCVEH